MTFLDRIDFGSLHEPTETPTERKEFVSRVVASTPLIEELLKRMLRRVGKDYFGNATGMDDIAVANGAIQFADKIKAELELIGAEELEQTISPETKEKTNIISSGSELGI